MAGGTQVLRGRMCLRRGWAAGFAFRFYQTEQQKKKGNQRQNEKERASVAVDVRIDHLRAHVYAEFADDENPQAITRQGEGNHGQGQNRPFAGRLQKNIARDNTGDEQGQA